jgi:hypothetical protein
MLEGMMKLRNAKSGPLGIDGILLCNGIKMVSYCAKYRQSGRKKKDGWKRNTHIYIAAEECQGKGMPICRR